MLNNSQTLKNPIEYGVNISALEPSKSLLDNVEQYAHLEPLRKCGIKNRRPKQEEPGLDSAAL